MRKITKGTETNRCEKTEKTKRRKQVNCHNYAVRLNGKAYE